MKAIALNRADTGAPQGYFCSACGVVYPQPDDEARAWAERCCTCADCGAQIGRSWCHPCRAKRDAARDAADYEKATKVPLAEYGERYVFLEGHGDDGYLATDSVDDLIDAGVAWAWGTTPEGASMDLEREVAENVLQDHHEDAIEDVDLGKIAEAQKLIDEALKDVETWHEDRSTVVVLPARAEVPS